MPRTTHSQGWLQGNGDIAADNNIGDLFHETCRKISRRSSSIAAAGDIGHMQRSNDLAAVFITGRRLEPDAAIRKLNARINLLIHAG